jgi:hypothetical protein
VPPLVGDTCILFFLERNADQFWKTGKVTSPTYAKTRRHDINDAIALVGYTPSTKLLTNYQEEGVELRNKERDTFLHLKNNNISIYVNKQNVDNSLNINVNNDVLLDLLNNSANLKIGQNVIANWTDRPADQIIYKIDPNVSQTFTKDTIEIKTTPASIVLNIGGITIGKQGGEVVINVYGADININSTGTITVKGSNIVINSPTTINGDVNIVGRVNIVGDTTIKSSNIDMTANNIKMTGAVGITGDLDLNAVKIVPKKLLETRKLLKSLGLNDKDTEATAGTLTTGTLYLWDVFQSKLILEAGAIHFIFPVSMQLIEINIPHETVLEMTDYQDLVDNLNENFGSLITAEYLEVDKVIKFITGGTGKEDGNIDYLEDIITQSGGTSGVLTTGSLVTDYSAFIESLNNLGLSFKINIGGILENFRIDFEEIKSFESFDDLAEAFEEQHSDIVAALYNSSSGNMTFTTIDMGSMNGKISYMIAADDENSPATLISGTLISWDDFKTNMADKDFGVQSTINGTSTIFYILNSDFSKYTDFNDFFVGLFANSALRVESSYNKLTLTTKQTGSSATLDYFSSISFVPASQAELETGDLPSYAQIKNLYGKEGGPDIIFSFEIDYYRNDYKITAQNLIDSNDWNDILKVLTPTGDRTTSINIFYENNKYVFQSPEAGRRTPHYLSYHPTEADRKTIYYDAMLLKDNVEFDVKLGLKDTAPIDGSLLLKGVAPFATLYNGSDYLNNFSPNSAALTKLTEATGAEIENGADEKYNSNSIYIMHGTSDSGAIATSGEDGDIAIINNSATLLKGTRDMDAILIVGLDPGEDPPNQYDGTCTFTGNMEIMDNIKCKTLDVSKGANVSGEINLTPRKFDPDDQTPPEVTDVAVDGGIKTRTLTVTESATIEKLTVNEDIDITGDLSIGGTLTINGIKISGGFSLSVSGTIYCSDMIAGW